MATYLPVLLGSVNAIPDDSAVPDLPRGQVDYLSHNWREEDVWRSWRSMTRLKNEIANGVRLENASWRTWWKQRNGLKTVTPETLNWLKDSDVTWLYGPLHTAEPTPKPSPSVVGILDLPSSPSPSLDGSAVTRKPILKHRSICELLTSDFPQSPVLSPPDSEEEEDAPQIMSDGDPGSPHKLIRPSLMHTKSDTHITRWGPNRAFRRDSPPRVVGEMPASSLLQSDSPPSSVVPGQKRKHISFNTFVEQCIAIDKPKKKRPHYSTAHPQFGHSYPLDDDGYDEDSEDGVIDEVDEMLFDDDDDDKHPDTPPHPYSQIAPPLPPHHSPPPQTVSPPSSSSTSEEEEDDDVLQMRVRHATTPPAAIPRSPSHSSSSTSSSPRSRTSKARSPSYAPAQRMGAGNSFMRSPSTDKELVTIAFIAPTMLKTKLDDDDDDDNFLPPQAPLHAHTRRTRSSHNGKDTSPHGSHDSPVELVYVPPSYAYPVSEDNEELVEGSRQTTEYEATLTDQPRILDQPLPDVVPTPVSRQDHNVDLVDPMQLLGPGVDPKATRISVPEDTSSITCEGSPAGPEVIVSSPDGHAETPRSRSRSKSRSRSRSRTPSPNTIASSTNTAASSSAVVLPRAYAPTLGTGGAFLVPSDSGISRGRSASSPSLSSQGQAEQSRGRSITRTSSFSDRESLTTGSPLGSLSPDGNVGLGIGSVGVRDRERDAKGDKEGRWNTERGRDRNSRRSGSHSGSGSSSSLSPEAPHTSIAAGAALNRPEPSVPEVRKKYTAESSSSGSSTVTSVSACAARSPPRLVLDAKPITQTSYTEAPSSTIPISPSLAQEEQESISRQPTPGNSPVLPMYSYIPSKSSPPPHAIRHERKSSGSSRSPTRRGEESQQDTLVGRAVEIMSNAGAFLGSFWHSGAPASVTTS
ncbi:hypothetical protein JVU11DRAFT_6533 [Chiua virens]|nr:hypothetical protein JVU11DRAFT_6533 [Chiua virens]